MLDGLHISLQSSFSEKKKLPFFYITITNYSFSFPSPEVLGLLGAAAAPDPNDPQDLRGPEAEVLCDLCHVGLLPLLFEEYRCS